MRQYSYSAIAPNGYAHTIRCTAARPEWARAQIVSAYAGWAVCDLFCDVGPAHKIFGEIDASNMTEADYNYLQNH